MEKKSRDACSIYATIVILAQICVFTFSSLLQFVSDQFTPFVITVACILLAVLTLSALHRHNSALIAVYIFLQPLFIGWNVFLFLLYLQIGPLEFPYDKSVRAQELPEEVLGSGDFESSGDGSNFFSDDEELEFVRVGETRSFQPVLVNATFTETERQKENTFLNILTLYTNTNKQSYLLAHPKLQNIVFEKDALFFVEEAVTLGRLLEVVLLLLIILLCSIGFLTSIFAFKKAREVETSRLYKDNADFHYQANFAAVNNDPNAASFDRLLQADSCDRILQSHPSFQRSFAVNMAQSSYLTRNRYPNHTQY